MKNYNRGKKIKPNIDGQLQRAVHGRMKNGAC
jgi:hypothetical protein